ncbi:MAG: hypothetical protein ABIZ50_05265, partial [Solirubrobacterales bacterium]
MSEISPDMTSQQEKIPSERANRKRFVAALCAAGLVAGAFGGNLLAAGAQEQAPVPGEQVAAPPTQIPSEGPGSGAQAVDPVTTTTSTTTTATTTTPPPEPTPPDTTTTESPAQTTTPEASAGDPAP